MRQLKSAGGDSRGEVVVPVVVICSSMVSFQGSFRSNKLVRHMDRIPASSGLRNASAPGRGLARARGPLAGVVMLDRWPPGCPCAGGPELSEPTEPLRWLSDDSSALFHRTTSSTASGLETGASLRRHPTIHACFCSFLAETRRLGSFWKHCIKKSRPA